MKRNTVKQICNVETCFYTDGLRRDLVTRLNRVAGQVVGLRKMIESERPCVEVLKQIAAVHAAMRGVGKLMMQNYMRTCVTKAIKAKDQDVYADVMDVIHQYSR